MALPRWMSLFDIGAIAVLALLPLAGGSTYRAESAALAAFRGKTDPAQVRWRVVMAQARAVVAPNTEHAVGLVGALTSASYGDWAVNEAHLAAAAEGPQPGWREAFLVSEAYADRLEPQPALAWANYARALCLTAGEGGAQRCPPDWMPRVDAYIKAFEAGVASGIDPRRNPAEFRAAGEAALRIIRPGAAE